MLKIVESKRCYYEFYDEYFIRYSTSLFVPKSTRKIFYKDIVSFSSMSSSINFASMGALTYTFKIRNDKDLKVYTMANNLNPVIKQIVENRTRVKMKEAATICKASPTKVGASNASLVFDYEKEHSAQCDAMPCVLVEESPSFNKDADLAERFYQIDTMLLSNDAIRRDFYFSGGSCMGLTLSGVFSPDNFSSEYLESLSSFGGLPFLSKALYDFFVRVRTANLEIPVKVIYQKILSANSYCIRSVLMKYYYTKGSFSDADLKELVKGF